MNITIKCEGLSPEAVAALDRTGIKYEKSYKKGRIFVDVVYDIKPENELEYYAARGIHLLA